jgi:two-component system sensor histidine kinase HydH
MSGLRAETGKAGAHVAGVSGLSPTDLAELAAAFDAVTSRLQKTHDALHAEVAQLKAELAEANVQVERSRRLAALGGMAAGISHEVRNPLGSIRLYAKMLKDDLADRPESRQVAEKILSAVSRLDAVVGDVLAFARELKVSAQPLEAGELLSAALEAARSEGAAWVGGGGGGGGGGGVNVVGPTGDTGRVVMGDANLLHQALVNVIRNAVEAMAEGAGGGVGVAGGVGGTEGAAKVLTLEVKGRVVRGAGKRAMVGLVVRDTGPGLSAEALERMFNPFFTTRATGTGLGLAIVHRIVDAHGGRVSVKNGKGGGAVVELVLPGEG